MGRFLIVDVGAGTVDLLCYDTDSNQHFKAVAKSPVKTLAEEAEGVTGNLLITGTEMLFGGFLEISRDDHYCSA